MEDDFSREKAKKLKGKSYSFFGGDISVQEVGVKKI